MRSLNSNEKRLLLILGIVAFMGANFFGLRALFHTQYELTQAYVQARGDRADASVDLAQFSTWKKRQDWLIQFEPTLTEQQAADRLEALVNEARADHLDILSQVPSPMEPGSSVLKFKSSLRVKGAMQDLCHWITEVEQPEKLIGISKLTLKADGDQKSMDCDLEIVQFGRRS